VRAAWLAFLALLGNAPALRNGFVLDDNVLVVNNPFVRSWSGLGQLLRHELFVASAEPRFVPYYRPLSGLLNWLSYRLVGASAPLQHGLNLLLHAGVTLAAFRALQALDVRLGVAFGLTLLFTVHPATAEVVAYIGGRQDMLGWLFTLAAVRWAAFASNLPRAAALGFVASLLGGFCHELFLASFLPLSLLVATAPTRGSKQRGVAVALGGVLAVAALLGLRAGLGLLPFEANVDGPLRATRAAVGVFARLLGDALFPVDLAVDVTVPLPGAGLSALLLALSAGLSLLLARAVARRRPSMLGPALAGLSIVAATCALHAGVMLKYGIISDRYAYALLIGLLLTSAALVETWLPETTEVPSPSALLGLVKKCGAVGLALAIVPLTWARDTSWRDQRALQQAMIAARPDDPESWLAEGMMHFAADELDAAYPKCAAYRQARPESDKANLCIGSWLLLQRRAPEAAQYLRPYALARPGMATARRTLLFALLAARRYDEAAELVERWLADFPGAPELLEAQSALAARQGRRP